MTYPIPPGTRDVLPDEMRELRALLEGLRTSFEQAGFGEVLTPTVEYEEVLRQGDERAAGAGYRLFDDHGRLLVLRSDMTIPIARMVSTRMADHEGPLRLCYFGHAYRSVLRGSGRSTEFLQAGAELIGVPGAEGDAEIVGLVLDGLEAVGLRRHRVGIGDGDLYRRLLHALEVPAEQGDELLACLGRRDLAGVDARVRMANLPEALVAIPSLRGGPEVLDRAEEMVGEVGASALLELRGLHEALSQAGRAERVIFDLGLVHELGYYTGAVFEIYDPAVGFALGGGGRYDQLLGRFGKPRPACGIALDVQRVHEALAAEEGPADG
jgi:ATP phosphoribosyltransferase regulatory subunit